MTCGVKVDLDICQGKTLSKVFRWGQTRKEYRQITAATQAAPCVITLASAPSNLPDGWAYQIEGAKGMTELNTKGVDGQTDFYRQAIVLTGTTLEINELNALDLAAYTGGGVMSYNLPMDLTNFSARMQVRSEVTSSTTLLDLTTTNGGIIIDLAVSTITVQATALQTANLAEGDAVYDLELVSLGSVVYQLAYGSVTISAEVTR